jgi:predicted protein tyrosine phosphatase
MQQQVRDPELIPTDRSEIIIVHSSKNRLRQVSAEKFYGDTPSVQQVDGARSGAEKMLRQAE